MVKMMMCEFAIVPLNMQRNAFLQVLKKIGFFD